MSHSPDKPPELSPVKRALLALDEMQTRLRAAEGRLREPLAVIGMSCRFPGGADDPARCWELLRAGRDAIVEVPADRWDVDAYYDPDPAAPGKMSTRWGGFLERIEAFDPELFGISPREAQTMDPQQRLLLEVAWEALERAGQAPERLAGSRTGVFVGISGADYAQILTQNVDPARIDAYFASGVAHSIASGRLSYCLGLRGPSLSIDTACSSSLVAVHEACQSVRARETDLAIAAGVNLVLLPDNAITFSKSQMMAADGRCKTFDARADGFVRAEGCGVVIIKRLADAIADGDPVLAVIRGTAVNQDGASSGLTAPNGASQEALLREALANAGVRPEEVGYVETHGTGTSLGDPIEVRALGNVFAPSRQRDAPLYIGSVKTNFGHQEASAGIAGLIKAVLCLQQREIPPSLHFETPNPHIAWEDLPFVVPTRVLPFPSTGARRIAGVSSVGFSGTNAHVIVEEAAESETDLHRSPAGRGTHVLTLSAKSQAALREQVRHYRDHLGAHPEQSLADVCHTAGAGRAHFAHRRAVMAKDVPALLAVLGRIDSGDGGGMHGELSGTARVKVAFLCDGDADHEIAMCRELYEREPVFREVVDRCAGAPASYALQVGLAQLWRSWGVEPTVIFGRNAGEYAAAYVAGLYTLEEGARLATERVAPMAHVREAVSFERGIQKAAEHAVAACIQMGPPATELDKLVRTALTRSGLHWLPSLQPGRDEWESLGEALATLYVRGVRIDWSAVDRPHAPRIVDLPTYPFQRQRYWIADAAGKRAPVAVVAADESSILGRRVDSPAFEATLFTSSVGPRTAAAFALDHRVFGVPILPGTAYIVMALEAATKMLATGTPVLREFVFHEALSVPETGESDVQLIARGDAAGAFRLEIFSRKAGASAWTLHATASAAARAVLADDAEGADDDADGADDDADGAEGGNAATAGDDAGIAGRGVGAARLKLSLRRCPERLDRAAFYADLAQRGLDFGPLFRGVEAISRGTDEAVGEVALPDELYSEAARYPIHPVLLDACLQIVAAAASGTAAAGAGSAETALFMPFEVGTCRVYESPRPLTRAHVCARIQAYEPGAQLLHAQLDVYDADGAPVASLRGIHLKRVGRASLERLREISIDSWLVDLAWERAGDGDHEEWANPRAIAAAIRPGIVASSIANGWEQWNDVEPLLDRVCRDYILRAFHELGWNPFPGEHLDTAALASRMRVKPQFARLFGRFLAILESDGVLRREGEGWRVVRAPQLTDPDASLDALSGHYPAFAAELTFTRRCGPQLSAALTGACDPLQLLFPGGDATLAEHLYRDSPSAQVYNGIVRDAVAAAVSEFPPERPLRVLEIGGGTASATAHVIGVLPSQRTKYLFTDVSPLFAARAQQRFAALGFVETTTLDIERSPREQGIDGEFDLVIAGNVLHATRDLTQTLAHVRQLLAPGGLLLAVEITRPQDWIDLSFGLTDGWWRFSDTTLRPEYPLLSAASWATFLEPRGFDEISLLPQAVESSRALSLNTVIVARAARLMQAALPMEVAPRKARRWLLLADRSGLAVQAAQSLRETGDSICVAYEGDGFARLDEYTFTVDPRAAADLRRLLREARATLGGSLDGVLHFWGIDPAAVRSHDLAMLRDRTSRSCGGALHLAQALLAEADAEPVAFWIFTRGGVALADQPVVPLGAALWGWARSLRLEHPEIRCISVDLDPGDDAAAGVAVLSTLERIDTEPQIAWRRRSAYFARLRRPGVARNATARLAVAADVPQQLVIRKRGVLDNLALETLARRAPERGEIEIRVQATGLNFRDVLSALDMYPGASGLLGSECSGRVVAIGAEVGSIRVGDEVVAIAPGAFATYVIARASLAVPKPRALSFAEAAALPNVLLTADWALNRLGRLQAGERVLIHAAAGGVGLAAVRLAQRVGAEIFATAGSEQKRAYLRSLGLKHVFDSRTLDFASAIYELTNGRGVDLVLNSLAGDFIGASFAAMAPGGRFLEIGRTDIWSPDRVRETHPLAQYHVIDLGKDYEATPEIIRPMLQSLLEDVVAGRLAPLPLQTFPLAAATDAFRVMAQARHIGKIVVTQPWDPPTRAGVLRPESSYLITGGLVGLGLAVADWMVEQGARHLVLLGRRAPAADAIAAMDRMSGRGARILSLQCDVGVEADVATIKTAMHSASFPPLAGVVHAAGSLDDGAIESQTLERYAKVFAAKIDGAWLLERATADDPLDFFVLFSSAAALFGSAGQTNHGAANAYLDALAWRMREQGRPAVSIQWGAWSDIGAAAGADIAERLREKGLGRLSPAEGLAAFGELLRRMPPQVAVVAADWARFGAQLPPGAAKKYVGQLEGGTPVRTWSAVPERTASERVAASTEPALLEQLASAPAQRRRALLQGMVHEYACKVLSLPAAHPIDLKAPLAGLGLDSLMAVELRNLLGRAIGRPLPATLLFDHPSIEALTSQLTLVLGIQAVAPVAAETPDIKEDDLLGRLESLSEDQLDALLTAGMKTQ